MPSSPKTKPVLAVLLIVAAIVLIFVFKGGKENKGGGGGPQAAAVAIGAVRHDTIELKRVLAGTLEPHAQFVVAPKVSGRIQSIPFDISDRVSLGDSVATLDAAEFEQEVNQAVADLAVAEANLSEAEASFEIAAREHQRVTTLKTRGIASEQEFDTAQTNLLAKESQVKVAKAQTTRAESALETARIRLSYTSVRALWTEGDAQRVVAERYVDEGDTVSANDPLLLIVDLNPIKAIINVTERDYGLLAPGMTATVTADSFPGKEFHGKITRISPIFQQSSRQARVELSLENPDDDLKPGMFVRAEITLRKADAATIVPYSSITRRGEETGIFLLDENNATVSWVPVTTGIRAGESIQVLEPELSGKVVTLGQHLLDDGSEVVIPENNPLAERP